MSSSLRRLAVFSSVAMLALWTLTIASNRVTASAKENFEQSFQKRLSDYIQLRRQIVERLHTNGDGLDEAGESGVRGGLADAIRDARQSAQMGEICGGDIAGWIARTVRMDLSGRSELDRQAILSEVPWVPIVRVNDPYPDGAALATMPPALLEHLFPLPPALQYRFLKDAVILLDVDANIIVDAVPNVLRERF